MGSDYYLPFWKLWLKRPRNPYRALSYYYVDNTGWNIKSEILVTDKEGNKIPQPAPPDPIWNESFRYYRLSQFSNDLFEAYRNLFLGFEALLNEIIPVEVQRKKDGSIKTKQLTGEPVYESEKDWFKRSLTEIHDKINLSKYVAKDSCPVDYIMKSQYEDVRCRLFHAKLPNAELPHSHLNPQDVKQAYEELMHIWRQIAGNYLNVPTGGCVTTYEGFKWHMEQVFSKDTKLSYTIDSSVPTINDTLEDIIGYEVNSFEKTDYKGAIKHGIVQVLGYEDIVNNTQNYDKPIYKIFCIINEEILYSISYIKSGLKISGVDKWECIYETHLVNSSHPSYKKFKT